MQTGRDRTAFAPGPADAPAVPAVCTYLLPIRRTRCLPGEAEELRAYFEELNAAGCEVLVVDGSPAEVFGAHARAWGKAARHVPVDSRYGYLNGKVNGIHTGVDLASCEAIIAADDDIRFSAENVAEMCARLRRAEVVRPQNYLSPLPWWGAMEAARMAINRALLPAGDYSGAVGFRRSAMLRVGHFDGDVLFDNEELVRHFAASGARVDYARDFFVYKRAPRFEKWLEQRPRQAYEDFGLRGKTIFFAALLPLAAFFAWRFGIRKAGCGALVCAGAAAAAAAAGRGGAAARVVPAWISLFAPLWILERAISTWLAFYWHLKYQGYPFGDRLLTKGIGRDWRAGGRQQVASGRPLRYTGPLTMDASFNPRSAELGDFPAAEFRAALHQAADWIADYREGIERLPIAPVAPAGAIVASLPSTPPEHAESLPAILQDFQKLIMPGLVHWGHPAFMGYFGSTTTAPGILAELYAAALNVNALTWRTSPAATELETVVLNWLRQWLKLPVEFEGVVYDTASISTMHALAAAREEYVQGARAQGLAGRGEVPVLRIYTSDQAHSSVEKAAIALGLGEENVCRIPTDAEFCMEFRALETAIARDRAAGLLPLAVVATAGTTSTASVDPIPAIAALCRAERIWLHIDAAYGGGLALLPEAQWITAGFADADSLVLNPHKMLFVPFDFSALFVRDLGRLRKVFALIPEYLRGDAAGAERNYMDYGVQLGRRFRALKAWMVFRSFGREGIAARIREHLRLAQLLRGWVEESPNFALLAPVTMGVVCFRAQFADQHLDALNEGIVQAVAAGGKAYLTHTRLKGKIALRVAFGNILTTERHLAEVWILLQETAERLRTSHPLPNSAG